MPPFGGLKGKTVQVRCGPAAVTEDEIRIMSLINADREDAESRLIRKPEDLPIF